MIIVLGDWRGVALRAVAALAFGILTLVWPEISLWALVVLFGAFAFVDGVFALIGAFGPNAPERRGWLILQGVVSIGIGVVTFVWPDVTALALLYLIAAWAFLHGVFQIAAAIALRRELTNEWLLVLTGALAIVFAVLLVITPGTGALVITWLIGWFAVFFGVMLLMLALRLRRLEAELEPDVVSVPRSGVTR
jgi:uncharacterized membrane protein HdeD (DUF308 family)